MFIVISNNFDRIPLDLQKGNYQIEQWTANEFFKKASSDEGIDIDEDGMYYDTGCLTEEIYEALLNYKDAGVSIVYYRFDDVSKPDFPMDYDEVKVYPAKQPEPSTVEATSEITPTPETVQEPTNDSTTVLTPEMNTPVEQQQANIPSTNGFQVTPTVPEQNNQSQNNPLDFNPADPNRAVFDPLSNHVPQSVQPRVPSNDPIPQAPVQSGFGNSGQLYGPSPSAIPEPVKSIEIANGVTLINEKDVGTADMHEAVHQQQLKDMLMYDDYDSDSTKPNRKETPAKVILFGSSKGGTGKTFTCLISAYWYAKTHPTEKIALADFDIIDGQVGITINRVSPTMQNFYKLYKGGLGDYEHLSNCICKSDHFSPNIDFFLAPAQDIPAITNDTEYWTDVFKLLITNYDVVFFDSGIDYLGKAPIRQLYKIADKIIITCNPSINSVKSVIRQFKTLSGKRKNNAFKESDNILSRVNIVLTRVYEDQGINDLVVEQLISFAPIVAAFGNIDDIVSQVQWFQRWDLIDNHAGIVKYLNKILEFND